MSSQGRRLARRIAGASVIVSLALTGCTTQEGRIGADDGSDPCRPYRVALDSTGDYFGQNIAVGAVIGALGGALAGYAAGGNARAAAIGAAAGAAIGAAGGYFYTLQQQQQGQALVQQMMNDVHQANAQIDRTQFAFDQLVACRNGLANAVRADLAAGRVARPEAERRMALVRQQYAGDIEIGRRIAGAIAERSANFEFANEQINPVQYVATGQTPLYVPGTNPPQAMGALTPGHWFWGSRIDDQWVKIYTFDNRVGVAPAAGLALYQQPAAPAAVPETPSSPQLWPQRETPPPPAPAPARRPPTTQEAAMPPATVRAPTPAPAGPATPASVKEAVSTNLAKKSAFSNSVQSASQRTGGFELAG